MHDADEAGPRDGRANVPAVPARSGAYPRSARHGRLLVAVEEAAHHDAEVERAYRDAFERSVDATAALAPRPVARRSCT